jgi:hypothetical protein
MNIKMKASEDFKRILDNNAVTVCLPDGRKYYLLPYWFSESGVDPSDWKPIFNCYKLGELPEELSSTIKQMRDNNTL